MAALAVAATVLASACQAVPSSSSAPSAPPSPTGGTIRVGVIGLDGSEEFVRTDNPDFDGWLDPQSEQFWWSSGIGNLNRCCLLRTLVTNSGRPVAEGGGELVPDLAESLPEISDDGWTWTFRLRRGLRYAPPLDDVEITAPDFVRALERALRPWWPDPADPAAPRGPFGGFFADFFRVIEGTEAFMAGQASTISGVRTPDPYTIEFTLTEPVGDFGDRLAFPSMAPIPPGASDGHDDGYGRFLVASGPYMVEGSEKLDYSKPADQQTPPTGLGPGGAARLVRNPSWDRASDPVRAALADRIELVNVPDLPPEAPWQALADGTVDLLASISPEAAEEERSAPHSGVRVEYVDGARAAYIPFNLGRPPFDDPHVRRAVTLAIDRAAAIATIGPGRRVSKHYGLDTLTRGLLTAFDPYHTPGYRGDIEAAKGEMAKSRYDHDHDGRCDDSVCQEVLSVVIMGFPWAEGVARGVAEDVRGIGLDLDLELVDPAAGDEQFGALFEKYVVKPETKPPLLFGNAWASDYPSAAAWFAPQVRGSGNPSMIGATDEQLAGWGYEIREVPSVDDRVARCEPLAGSAGAQCWAELEQYLHDEVVPWVPLFQVVDAAAVSDRVKSFEFDSVTSGPAFDRIAVAPG